MKKVLDLKLAEVQEMEQKELQLVDGGGPLSSPVENSIYGNWVVGSFCTGMVVGIIGSIAGLFS